MFLDPKQSSHYHFSFSLMFQKWYEIHKNVEGKYYLYCLAVRRHWNFCENVISVSMKLLNDYDNSDKF